MKREGGTWLVKTGGRILGPFTVAQVGKLLQDKEISIVDEVSEPFRRWQMLREARAFAETIERVRATGTSGDDITTSGDSFTASVTENIHGTFDSDITEDISGYQSQLKEIVYEDIPESQKTRARPMTGNARFQSASAIDPNRIRVEADKSSRWMWFLTIAVFVAIAILLGAKRFFITQTALPPGFTNTASLGLALFNEGDYPAAIEILKKAHASEPSRKDLWLPLGLLLIQVDGQTVEARRLIQMAIDNKSDNLVVLWTAMGLAHLVDGDYANAQALIKKANAVDPDYLPLKVNSGVASLLSREYDQARKIFSQVLARGFRDGGVALQLVVANISYWQSGGEKAVLSEALRMIGQFQKQSADFSQELRLAQVYLEFLKGEDTDLGPKFRRILDVDPRQSDDFRHAAIISRAQADWVQLGQWCKRLTEKAGEIPEAVALMALCEQRQGRPIPAKTTIEKAVNQAPKDALLQAVYASILRDAGFGGEASVALGRAVELDRRSEYILPPLLQARFCQERDDMDCANTYWMKVLEFDPKSPAAKVGMARIYKVRNSTSEAERLLQEVAFESPDYRPYLRLQRQINAAKRSN